MFDKKLELFLSEEITAVSTSQPMPIPRCLHSGPALDSFAAFFRISWFMAILLPLENTLKGITSALCHRLVLVFSANSCLRVRIWLKISYLIGGPKKTARKAQCAGNVHWHLKQPSSEGSRVLYFFVGHCCNTQRSINYIKYLTSPNSSTSSYCISLHTVIFLGWNSYANSAFWCGVYFNASFGDAHSCLTAQSSLTGPAASYRFSWPCHLMLPSSFGVGVSPSSEPMCSEGSSTTSLRPSWV